MPRVRSPSGTTLKEQRMRAFSPLSSSSTVRKIGASILIPSSPRFTCRPSSCHLLYPATLVAFGLWTKISKQLFAEYLWNLAAKAK
jgi:hypothetical protein